jgi:hypothetical protein
MQVCTPVLHEVMPTLQTLGFVVHDTPAVHAMQLPALLHTMFGPQAVPGAFCVLSLHTIVPVPQVVTPVKQGLGLFVQLAPAVHEPQLPLPSHTRLVPQLVPPILLLPSAQAIVPVAHE